VGHARGFNSLAGTPHGSTRPAASLCGSGHRDRASAARLAFGRPWRQTEGLLRSIVSLLGVGLTVPDHTTFSWRSPGLFLATAPQQSAGPVDVVIDSTGLKVYGAGEWQAERHGERGRRTWRKLHLAMNPDSGEILASELTGNEVGDPSMMALSLQNIQICL
jgi:Transposase DDE domain